MPERSPNIEQPHKLSNISESDKVDELNEYVDPELSKPSTFPRRTFLKMITVGAASTFAPQIAKSESNRLPPISTEIKPNLNPHSSLETNREREIDQDKFPTFAELELERKFPSPYGYIDAIFDDQGRMNFTGKYPYSEYVSRSISSQTLPFYSPESRSAQKLQRLAEIFNVEENLRYTKDENTWCNFFLQDFSEAAGVQIPHFYKGKEQVANNIYTHLTEQTQYGVNWHAITEDEARIQSNQGKIVVGAIYNNTGRAGHVFIGMPTPPESDHIYAVQAGGKNFIGQRYEVEKYNDRNIYTETSFFIHQIDRDTG